MKHTLFIVALLMLTGCQSSVKPSPSKPLPSPPPTMAEPSDKEKIAMLRAEAHKRGLKWRIVCSDYMSDPQSQFLGQATFHNAPFSLYIEDGGKGLWLESGPTQADTAYALYMSIQSPQTHPAEHRPNVKHDNKSCPPELRGE